MACGKDTLGKNMSGLVYEPASASAEAVLWGVQNDPAKLHRLSWNGTAFVPVTSDAWGMGKLLHYPNASGSPDVEGVTRTDWATSEVYVVAERDNAPTSGPRKMNLSESTCGNMVFASSGKPAE